MQVVAFRIPALMLIIFIYWALTALFDSRCAMDEDGDGEGAPVDEDTCSGDSGSPVIIRLSNGEDVQVGKYEYLAFPAQAN